jgi:hypothetical protein
MGHGKAHRFLASPGTPSSALHSGNLLVFPSPWSGDHGAVASTFSGRRAGPRHFSEVSAGLAIPLHW